MYADEMALDIKQADAVKILIEELTQLKRNNLVFYKNKTKVHTADQEIILAAKLGGNELVTLSVFNQTGITKSKKAYDSSAFAMAAQLEKIECGLA